MTSLLVLVVTFLFSVPPQGPPDAQQIINQTISAHGGAALSQINNSNATVLFTDYRATPSVPRPATLRSFGQATRLDYSDARGPLALVRNGALLWETRGGSVQEYAGQPPAFQNGFFNPSLGLVPSLSTQDFPYVATAALLGRSVYGLRKSYWTVPWGSSNHRGTQEFVYVYIDAASHLVSQIDYTYGSDYNRVSFHFDNYTSISGIAVPMTITYGINDRMVWQMQVQTISFNQSVNPQDFAHP
ncbi:MAG: hypothetical protein HYR55_18020 [Acidobacteria bacterium]|nr:hypothetical protein [Acidobacteriota bacterium]MBI3655428.1 hypothetical protein [Acidobacteriota bacterium]